MKFRKLGRGPVQRRSMLRRLATALVKHERIVTTLARAKELKRVGDKVSSHASLWIYTAEHRCMIAVSDSHTFTLTYIRSKNTTINSRAPQWAHLVLQTALVAHHVTPPLPTPPRW